MSGHIRTAYRMSLRERVRTPLLLGLLAVLPVSFVGVASVALPDTVLSITVQDSRTAVSLSNLVAALTTPTVAALVGGVLGLFLIQSSRAIDRRLVVCGYRRSEIVLSRLCLVASGAVLVTGVAVGTAMLVFEPQSIGLFAVATVSAALVYGAVGIVVGTLFGRLAGVYAMMFGPLVDIVILQNPLAGDTERWLRVLPGHYVAKVAVDASFGAGFDSALLLPLAGVISVCVALACLSLGATST